MSTTATKPAVDTGVESPWEGFNGALWRVEVLPFHQMGRFEWEKLGLDYTLRDTEPPTQAAAEQACEVFRRAGLKAY